MLWWNSAFKIFQVLVYPLLCEHYLEIGLKRTHTATHTATLHTDYSQACHILKSVECVHWLSFGLKPKQWWQWYNNVVSLSLGICFFLWSTWLSLVCDDPQFLLLSSSACFHSMSGRHDFLIRTIHSPSVHISLLVNSNCVSENLLVLTAPQC